MILSSLYGKNYLIKNIVKNLSLSGNEKVLDLGCGRGLLLIAIAKELNSTGHSYGIDLWKNEDLSNNDKNLTLKNCALAKVEDKVTIVTGDMAKMDFANNFFDVVVSSMAIHNLDKKDRISTFTEIDRILKPGGKMLILDFQYVKEYKKFFADLGWEDLQLSKKIYYMFPPVRILVGKKSLC